jgi:hypothetical protein
MKFNVPLWFFRGILLVEFCKVIFNANNGFTVAIASGIFICASLLSLNPVTQAIAKFVSNVFKNKAFRIEGAFSLGVFFLLCGIVILVALEKFNRGESLIYIPVIFCAVIFVSYFLLRPKQNN